MVESPVAAIKVDRRGLANNVPPHAEPPSPMSHAKILARHATFAPRTEEEKAFGSPIPSPSGRGSSGADGDESPGRKKSASATSPRPAGRASGAATPEKKRADSVNSPRRKFSFPKMGFFTRGAKQRDAPSPAAPPRAVVGTPPRRNKGSILMEPRDPSDQRITLILDLDETLVRSSFDVNFDADFEAPRVRPRPYDGFRGGTTTTPGSRSMVRGARRASGSGPSWTSSLRGSRATTN